MAVQNADIAEIFQRIAALLELQGANPFRVRAYRQAARTINDLPQSVTSLVEKGSDLKDLPHIGRDLAAKITAIVETGKCETLEKLKTQFPPGLIDLLHIKGLGPKRVAALYQQFNIKDANDLRRVAAAGELQQLPGFSDRSVQKILRALDAGDAAEKRVMWVYAQGVALPLLNWLKKFSGVKRATVAGSFRRKRETVGDLDILVTCKKDTPVMQRFVEYEEVAEVVSKGSTRSTVILRNGLQVDLRLVPETCYGAALHYFTGAKAHNIAVRERGIKRGLKINEYGIFKGDKRLAGRAEEDVYKQLGLPYIEPEIRENRGELEAAQQGKLPRLIVLTDIHGDLHAHTRASDGRDTLEAMVEAARERGYDYLAITEHTKHLTIAHGLDEKRLRKQCEEIDQLNERLKGFTVLKSAEVDILDDGSLDLPDSILKELDLTVCAVHYKFDLPAKIQTERIIRAMDNRHFNILAHPTGRLIDEREPYKLNMERLMNAAREKGCILEINSQPERLDLNDIHCRMAKDLGVKLAISTDSHSAKQLDNMRFGIAQARRGWVERGNVINTRPLKMLKKMLKRE